MSFFGSLIGTISKIATTAYTILKTAKPILEALRPAVKEIDDTFIKIEEGLQVGGVAADDFLDRNLETIDNLEMVSARGIDVFTRFHDLSVKLRLYSQVETPDEITEAEMIDIGKGLYDLRILFKAWGPELDEAIAKMAEIE